MTRSGIDNTYCLGRMAKNGNWILVSPACVIKEE